MTLIQILLLLLILGLALMYSRLFRNKHAFRALFGLVFIIGALAVIFPDLTTMLANFMGVSRGADLLFYLFIISVVFFGALLYQKICDLEEQQTIIIRQMALLPPTDAEGKQD